MSMTHLLNGLNAPQLQAVTSHSQHLLVLAGAGSGKTRVLVHRIAWLIQEQQIPPHAILAVTFTNKAAREMSMRIEALLGHEPRGMWVGTFHGLAHRLLRTHWQEAGLVENFQVLDSDDQKRLIKRLMKEMAIDEKELPAKDIQWFINHQKENGLRYRDLTPSYHVREKTLQAIYEQYELLCQRNSLVDFSELLLRAHELWLHQPHLLQHYQQRFSHLLIDEFQDTNTIQYAWIRVLAGASGHLMVVGDDDQSIYGWRGAKIEHIQQFQKDFAPAKLIRLEQNYRSTSKILEAANAVIEHNINRLGKTLWTQSKQGEPVYLFQAYNEYEEAEYIVGKIISYLKTGMKRGDIAILYRSNAQSRILEEVLLKEGIPYRVYGGLRFFDRAEIRDALAYLRLIYNPADDAAFERVINLPARGIGQRSIEKMRIQARSSAQSLWNAAKTLVAEKKITGKAAVGISEFMRLLEDLHEVVNDLSLLELMEQVYEHSGLLAYHGRDNNERARSRVENLEELLNALKQFEASDHDEREPDNTSGSSILADFLSHAVLESSEGQAQEWDDSVQLMTLHSAKGLEFPCVFLAGMEQGLFPHKMSADDPLKLQEERRLCYVGITRAMKILHLCHADVRSIHGHSEFRAPSQFIAEIPGTVIQRVRRKSSGFSATSSMLRPEPSAPQLTPFTKQTDSCQLRIGKVVQHKKFGEGVVLALEGEGKRQRVQVRFDSAGERWLLASVANLS